jgi:coenzyme F420-0:L-glutamate ligase/coenzyme F420-1:gamma-L-glutamate ligase
VSAARRLEVVPLDGLGEIAPDDPLGALIAGAAHSAGLVLDGGDVVVVSQKAVSKAEGRIRDLGEIEPGARARELATGLAKDPRLVQVILDESRGVIRAERGVLIVETRGGLICANAGVDASNVPGGDVVTLLPSDPDGSARRIRGEIEDAAGVRPAVVVSDSFGRPWRLGQTDVAIGSAGLRALDDWRGRADRHGKELTATQPAIVDEVAAAADLAREKDQGVPVVIVSGLERFVTSSDGPGAAVLRRPEAEDLFR